MVPFLYRQLAWWWRRFHRLQGDRLLGSQLGLLVVVVCLVEVRRDAVLFLDNFPGVVRKRVLCE